MFSGCFLWPCWVPTICVLILSYRCSEAKVCEAFEDGDARRTQPPVDCLWSLAPPFSRLSCITLIDFVSFVYALYVILLLLLTFFYYMYETWSWHTYRYALGLFFLKPGVTCRRLGAKREGGRGKGPWGSGSGGRAEGEGGADWWAGGCLA
jgi:hypothetical protein